MEFRAFESFSERNSESFLFRGTAEIPSELNICSIYSVFRGIIILSTLVMSPSTSRYDSPVSLGNHLNEILHWFETLYEKNPLGCIPAWKKIVETIGKTDKEGFIV